MMENGNKLKDKFGRWIGTGNIAFWAQTPPSHATGKLTTRPKLGHLDLRSQGLLSLRGNRSCYSNIESFLLFFSPTVMVVFFSSRTGEARSRQSRHRQQGLMYIQGTVIYLSCHLRGSSASFKVLEDVRCFHGIAKHQLALPILVCTCGASTHDTNFVVACRIQAFSPSQLTIWNLCIP